MAAKKFGLRRRFKNTLRTNELLEERAMLAVLAGDVGSAFEANETLGQATDLGDLTGRFSTNQSIQIDARIGDWNGSAAINQTDVDIYRVELRAGDLVTFDVDAQRLDDGTELCDPETGAAETSNADNFLRLFRIPSGPGVDFVFLDSNDSAVAPGDAVDENTVDPAIVDFVVPVTDTYYVAVSGHSDEGNDYNPVVTGNRNATPHTGQYRLTITATDDDNKTPTVDVTAPGTTDGDENVISWEISDESGIVSSTAQVWKGSQIIRPDSPVPLEGSFDLEEFGAGIYRITITAEDGDDDYLGDQLTNIHSVLFMVMDDDTNAPEILLSPSASLDGANNIVSWDISDESGIASFDVEVWRDDMSIFTTTADAAGSLDLNEFGIGDYVIKATAIDADSDSEGDSLANEAEISFTIIDDDTEPPTVVVSAPNNRDGADNIASWNVQDPSNVDSVTVLITRGNEVILEEDRTPTDNTFDLNSVGVGEFQITISAVDADRDWVGDESSITLLPQPFIIVDDDVEEPAISIELPNNIDGSPNVVSWTATDASGVASTTAIISKNGEVIFDSSVDPVDAFDLDAFGIGNFTITVAAEDGDSDWANDSLSAEESRTFTIIDDDIDSPAVTIIKSDTSDGTGNFFSWTVNDFSGLDSLDATITRNGETIFDEEITAVDRFDIDEFGIGDYTITINAVDADNDWVGDVESTTVTQQLTIVDDDVQKPVIAITGPGENDGLTNNIGWAVEDNSGVSDVQVTITFNGETIREGNALGAGSLNVDQLGLGEVVVTVTATDADNDWDGDQLTESTTETFTIVDDDNLAPTQTLLPVDLSTQTDGDNNVASWTAEDPSGVGEVRVQVQRDGVTIVDRSVRALDDIDLNEFGPGEYFLTLRATDADTDWFDDGQGDTRTSIEAINFFVVDDDTDKPVINLVTPDSSDGSDNSVSWTVEDASGVSSVILRVIQNGNSIDERAVEATGSYDLNELGIGEYQVVVTAVDADSDWVGDSLSETAGAVFSVVDDDDMAPEITLETGGALDGEDNVISWAATDASGLESLTVTISKDGQVIATRSEAGSFDANSLGLGLYEVSVTAVDADKDWEGDQRESTFEAPFSIADDDTRGPSISIAPADGTEEPANTPNQFVWSVSDPSGIGGGTVRIEQQVSDLEFNIVREVALDATGNPTSLNGEESLDDLGLGTFRITIDVTDADNDREGDASSSTRSSSLAVSDASAPTVTGASATDPAIPLTPGVVDFVFSEDVSGSLDATDFILRNLSTGQDVAVTQEPTWNAAERRATLDLSGVTDLDQGVYTVVMSSSGVLDSAGNSLDGDSDGTAGGDFSDESAIRFHVTWAGDADRDVDVDFEDFLILSTNFAQEGNWSDGDFNGDGQVEFLDFLQLSLNFGLDRKV